MLAVDTNVLVYAADLDSPFHAPCRDWLERQRARPDAWYTTWPILYEFLRVTTHPRVMRDRTRRLGVCFSIARLTGPLASYSRRSDMLMLPDRLLRNFRTSAETYSTTPTQLYSSASTELHKNSSE